MALFCLSIAQASPSFKCLNSYTYFTPTFITETLHLIIYVLLFQKNPDMKVTAYTVLA